jgi:hypothetical protein
MYDLMYPIVSARYNPQCQLCTIYPGSCVCKERASTPNHLKMPAYFGFTMAVVCGSACTATVTAQTEMGMRFSVPRVDRFTALIPTPRRRSFVVAVTYVRKRRQASLSTLQVVHSTITYSGPTATFFLGGAGGGSIRIRGKGRGGSLAQTDTIAAHLSPFFYSSLLMLRGARIPR